MSIEAMKLALEALENHSGNYKLSKAECVKYRAVEEALRQAIEQAQKQDDFRIYFESSQQKAVNKNKDYSYGKNNDLIIGACEYADSQFAGASIPFEWLEHFVDGIYKQKLTSRKGEA